MRENKALAFDSVFLRKVKGLSLMTENKFTLANYDKVTQIKIKEIPSYIQNKWKEKQEHTKDTNNWKFMTKYMGSYGTNYNIRAIISLVAFGANLPKDAVYPTTNTDDQGDLLKGENKYVIHFEKGQTPPVNAFWSLTCYNSENFLVHNPINRYALNDRDKMKYNTDGSLDIYLQNTPTAKDKTANWLPCPRKGEMSLVLRLYWPKKIVLTKEWKTPQVIKTK